MSNDDPERWLPVLGYEGLYEISDLGRVRSVDRDVVRGAHRTRRKGKILNPGVNSAGYRQARLSRNGVATSHTVHSLVAAAFIGPRPCGPRSHGLDVLHGPLGQLDNRVSNLRYGTPSENMADTVRDGTNWWRDRSRCLRGHPLDRPNLMPSALPRRNCLACNRGACTVRHAAKRGRALDLQTEADRHYALIMEAQSGQDRHCSSI